MAELRNLRRQEVFLNMKRYLGMVKLLTFVTSLAFVPWFPIYIALVSIGRPSKPQLTQTRSSSALSQPSKLPPPVQPANPKRKRSSKGKDPVDGGSSFSSQEEDEAR